MPSSNEAQVGRTGEGDASTCDITRHPDLTSVVLQSQDPFIQALIDARRANERAVQIGMGRLPEVDQRYYNGVSTCQSMTAEQAYTTTGVSAANLNALLYNLWSKIPSAPIYKLPVELMCLIFSNLDMDTLFICRATCRLWNKILASNAARKEVWRGTSVILQGSLAEVVPKWEAAIRTQVIPASLTLRIDWPCSYEMDFRWKSHGFLTSTLRELKYEGSPFHDLDKVLWKSIKRCNGLKLLHWTTKYRNYEDDSDTYESGDGIGSQYNCYAVTSAFCRLEDFKLEPGLRIKIDIAFVRMLSRVKRLHVSGLSVEHMLAIFKAARETLEEITISLALDDSDIWTGKAPEDYQSASSYYMNKLQWLSLKSADLPGVKIVAPHLTTLHFDSIDNLDWSTLDSCRNGLKSLHIELWGKETRGSFGQEIFDMPQLISLHLDYKRVSSISYDSSAESIRGYYQSYSAAAFWDAVNSDDAEKMHVILPRLKKLKIVHDPLLDEPALMKFVEWRSKIGHPPIEEVCIWLANHCSDQTDRLKQLAKASTGFTYQLFEQWKESHTRKWWKAESSLRWRTGMDWISIEFCRYSLERLTIYAEEPDNRLEQELFDMPKLKQLHLNFTIRKGEDSGASATALWRAISTGSSGNPEVSLRDILPSLDDLMVFNDIQLDEKLILKFIEMRQSLGLQPLWRLTVSLARDCSEHHARLDSLKETIPYFSYKLYDQS